MGVPLVLIHFLKGVSIINHPASYWGSPLAAMGFHQNGWFVINDGHGNQHMFLYETIYVLMKPWLKWILEPFSGLMKLYLHHLHHLLMGLSENVGLIFPMK